MILTGLSLNAGGEFLVFHKPDYEKVQKVFGPFLVIWRLKKKRA